jgi:hypothetical protein
MLFAKQGAIVVTAVALVAATLAASGCGKASKAETSPTTQTAAQSLPAPSTEPSAGPEFISKANTMCRRLAARRASNRARSLAEVARLGSELAAFEQALYTEMAEVAPSVALANDWKRILTGAQTLAADTAKISNYAKANEFKSAAAQKLIAGRHELELQTIAIAKRDGMKDCAHEV